MKGRLGRSVVLGSFILLSITMAGNVQRFDFGIGKVKAAYSSEKSLKASALERGARANTRVTGVRLE
jgi:hypothetical protein